MGGQPIVQVLLNKTQSAAFMMDTGASSCILSPDMAKRLNLKLQPGIQDNGAPYLWKGKPASERVLIDFPGKKMYLQSNTATVPTITVGPQTPGAATGK